MLGSPPRRGKVSGCGRKSRIILVTPPQLSGHRERMSTMDRTTPLPAEDARDCGQTPLVTIVTPTLNMGRFLDETIQSVLSQDYPQIEYIVIDGGSTDQTLDVVKKYQDRLQ